MTTIEEHQQQMTRDADHFTAVRGMGFKRTKETFPDLDAAEAYASGFGDGRTMLYAVTADGRSAHLKNA